jgi:hypothetical protein
MDRGSVGVVAHTMTAEQARIVVLEDALEQAQNTVSFMHGCLTDPVYTYAYPDQTQHHLAEWAALVPVEPYCVHSRHHSDCESCQRHVAKMERLAEARRILG